MSEGRPFQDCSVEELEAKVREARALADLKSLRAELTHRRSKRARELDDLLARLIRSWTGTFDPTRQ